MAEILKGISEKIIVSPECRETFLRIGNDSDLHQLGIVRGGVSRVVHPYHICRPAGGHSMLAFTLEGKGSFRDATGTHAIMPGTLWILPVNCPQDYWTDDEWFYVWFDVLPHGAAWDVLTLPSVGIPRPCGIGQTLRKLAELHAAEDTNSDVFSEQLIQSYTRALAMHLRRELECDPSDLRVEQRMRLEALWQEVIQDYARPWTLNDLARRFHLSVPQFNRVVIEHEGIPPMKKVTRLRMQHACRLLLYTSYSLDDIAGILGYSTAYALSKTFRRTFGCPPGEYRQTQCGREL